MLEEMCVPVSVRVSVRACAYVCERVHAGRESDALDGGTQMWLNCRAWTPNPLTSRLRGRGSKDKDSHGVGSNGSQQAPPKECARGTDRWGTDKVELLAKELTLPTSSKKR